jgi:hypothetical protein
VTREYVELAMKEGYPFEIKLAMDAFAKTCPTPAPL